VRGIELRTVLASKECVQRLKASLSPEGEILGEVFRKRFFVWNRNSLAYSPVFRGMIREENGSTEITGGFNSSAWKKYILPLLFVTVIASLIAANLNDINTGVSTLLPAIFSFAVPVYFLVGLKEEWEIVTLLGNSWRRLLLLEKCCSDPAKYD